MKIDEILLEASDILEKKGWCRGSYENDEGCHCMLGVLFEACEKSDTPISMPEMALTNFLRVNNLGSIISFNDFKARDKQHVQEMLQAAAKSHQ